MSGKKRVLISGASFAGLATAFWMKKLGYSVTVVEIAGGLRRGGTPVDIKGNAVEIFRSMGLYEQVWSNRLPAKSIEFVNLNGVAGLPAGQRGDDQPSEEEYEIERDVLLNLIFNAAQGDVEFVFGDSVTRLNEKEDGVEVAFKHGLSRSFDLVFGCDGVHSAIRKYWFGEEKEFFHFLKAYGSVSIVNKLLIGENSSQIYNEPGKAVILSTYNKKTDIILMFSSEEQIPYDYRDEKQKQNIVMEQFAGVGWRAQELVKEMKQADNFYFDALSQIKMRSWTKGRVALVGDAAYCASPAAGRGGSLAIEGAAALADAFKKCDGDFQSAFGEYDASFRPFIEKIQAEAASAGIEFVLPSSAEAIQKRLAGALSAKRDL